VSGHASGIATGVAKTKPGSLGWRGTWLAAVQVVRLVTLVVVAGCAGAPLARDAGQDAAPATAPDAATADASPTAGCPVPTAIDPTTARELVIAGDPGAALGSFDPSVVYPGDATGGAMAYSAVPDQHSIRTRLAVSSDHGASWTYVAEANQPEAATIASSDALDCPTGSCTGFLISEVPSLVFDADDPVPSRRWKLFTHRYLVSATNQLHYQLGTIALQTAGSPAGPWTAPAKLIGWQSPSAYSSTGIVTNVNTLPGDQDCLTLTEPGALWLPGTLELAMGCVYLDGTTPRIRVILVRSVDHAASWSAVATLLTPADSGCLVPGGSINAPDLFVAGGKEYISATSGLPDGTYRGCAIYPIDDPVTGAVHRDASGHAVPVRTMAAPQFSGACTFAEGSGYLLDIGLFGQPRPFRIFYGPSTGP